MNAPILKLFGLVLVLFMALIAMTSYNSVINADAYLDVCVANQIDDIGGADHGAAWPAASTGE